MDKEKLLESMDKELKYYRNRMFAVFSYAIGLEILVITGKITIRSQFPTLTNIAYSVLLMIIVFFVFRFQDSYRIRIHRIRWEKNNLTVTNDRSKGYFPPPFGDNNYDPEVDIPFRRKLISSSPSMQYVYIVLVLALLNILLIWSSAEVVFNK